MRRQKMCTKQPHEDSVLFYKFMIALIAFSFVIYAIVIYVILRYKKIFYDTHFFYKFSVILGVFDLLGLILSLGSTICYIVECSDLINIYLLPAGHLFLLNIVVFYQLLLASNRCCAILFYTRYEEIFSEKRSRFYFLFCIVFIMTIMIPLSSCKRNKTQIFEYVWLHCWYYEIFYVMDRVFISVADIMLAVFYIISYFGTKKQMQALYQSGNSGKERRFLYQGSIISIVFMIDISVSAAYVYEATNCDFWKKSSILLMILSYCINPYVYLSFNTVLRRYFINTILFRKIGPNGDVISNRVVPAKEIHS